MCYNCPLDFFFEENWEKQMYIMMYQLLKKRMRKRTERAYAAIDQNTIQCVTQSISKRFRQCFTVYGHYFKSIAFYIYSELFPLNFKHFTGIYLVTFQSLI